MDAGVATFDALGDGETDVALAVGNSVGSTTGVVLVGTEAVGAGGGRSAAFLNVSSVVTG